MYPLNSKQQKSSRLMNKINPEIKAIQKKYKNKKDQASQMKMNQETQDIYAKYGISPFGGCLPLLITMPILFALYNVIRNIPYYVNGIGSMKENPEAYKFLGLFVNESPMSLFKDRANYPYAGILVFLIPILAMVLQFINTKLLQVKTDAGEQDQMQNSMKMMNYMMPLYSVFIVFFLPVGVGIYWIAGSLIRSFQQFLLNKHFDTALEEFKKHIVLLGKEEKMNSQEEVRSYFTFYTQAGQRTSQELHMLLQGLEKQQSAAAPPDPYRYEQLVDGRRTYLGCPIPDGAPPRPDNTAFWNETARSWTSQTPPPSSKKPKQKPG